MNRSGVDVLDRLPQAAHSRIACRADLITRVLDRAAALPRPERIIVNTIIGAGIPAADLAVVARTPPRAMQRRVERLLRRLESDTYTFALRHADRMPPVRRAVAQAVLLQGMSQRQAAAHLNISFHTVRKELERIHGLRDLQSTLSRRHDPSQHIDEPDHDTCANPLGEDERWTSL